MGPPRRARPPSVALLAVILLAIGSAPASNADDVAPPWTVFSPADGDVAMGDNVLANPGFESDVEGGSGRARDWSDYVLGYQIDETGGRGGSRALMLTSADESEGHGARQALTLDQSAAKPLYFSAWSKADGVSGDTDGNYSVYLDLRYDDGTPLYGQTLRFATGTHGWQLIEGFIVPAKPVASLSVYCLLRNTHRGTVWFDDLTLSEVDAEILTFDGAHVATSRPDPSPFGEDSVSLVTGDGLRLGLAQGGGAVTDVSLSGKQVVNAAREYAGGFFIRDAVAQGDFVHVGGAVTGGAVTDGPATDGGETVSHTSELEDLGLSFSARYTAADDRIAVRAEVTASTAVTRSLTLYFALPIDAAGWSWGDDVRTARPVEGVEELSNLRWRSSLGTFGHVSKYPWAAMSGPDGGLAIAVPLDSPRVLRLVTNPVTGQLYLAFDLGVSPHTAKFPNMAWVDFAVYRFDPEWGFRAAAQGYYDRFPAFFERRVPPEREGVWVAFSDLSPIPDIDDFGIAFHELGGLGQVEYDDGAGVMSFRYIAEPWSHWMRVDDPDVDPTDYEQTIEYLRARHAGGDRRAEATLSSGFFDDAGRFSYRSTVAPWCDGVSGCAVFTVNPDPDIHDPDYPLSKGALEWGDADRATYETLPGLDGEYIDSYLGQATEMDFRTSHFAATDTPLTFRTADARVGIPQVFATTEFARWLTDTVHDELGRYTMANGMLSDMPWGADLFDFMGRETNWLRTGAFVPDSDARLSYQRTMSYRRPYGLLMNTEFENLTHALVERYFQVALFYGIYPSMFSHNASSDRYWDDPALYERDRPLFKRYVPLIRELNAAGWQPITLASTEDESVIVERFGTWPDLYFTLRNTNDTAPATVELALDAPALGLPSGPLPVACLVSGGSHQLSDGPSDTGPPRTVTLTLEPGTTEVIRLSGGAVHLAYLPSACASGGSAMRADVVLLIDTSASMSGSRLASARAAAATLLDQMNLRRDHAAVIGFDRSPRTTVRLTADRGEIDRGLDALRAGSSRTRFDLAIATARRELLDGYGERDFDNRGVIVMLSDGHHDGPANDAIAEAFFTGTAGFAIYTIGLDPNADQGLLAAIADTDAHFAVSDESGLAPAFEAIATRIRRLQGWCGGSKNSIIAQEP